MTFMLQRLFHTRVKVIGLEPMAYGLPGRRSTPELNPHIVLMLSGERGRILNRQPSHGPEFVRIPV